jgi:hypothetical protein
MLPKGVERVKSLSPQARKYWGVALPLLLLFLGRIYFNITNSGHGWARAVASAAAFVLISMVLFAAVHAVFGTFNRSQREP